MLLWLWIFFSGVCICVPEWVRMGIQFLFLSLSLSSFHFPLTSLPPFPPPPHPLPISPLSFVEGSGSKMEVLGSPVYFRFRSSFMWNCFEIAIFLGGRGKTGLCKVLNKFAVTTDLFRPILVELYFNKISFIGKLLISSPSSNLVAWVCKSNSSGSVCNDFLCCSSVYVTAFLIFWS